MSGGVDSSVTALDLMEQGWDVAGFTMKIPMSDNCNPFRHCCGDEAAQVCRHLGIPHYQVDTLALFQKKVIDPFRRSYLQGATASPCVDCNTQLKFKTVWDLIEQEFHVQHLATGHYATVLVHQGNYFLGQAKDKTRDQSYFLYGIPRQRLKQVFFPLGDLSKTKVREVARKYNLHVAEKPDSQDLCFVAEEDYQKVFAGRDKPGPGPIFNLQGQQMGIHKGIHHYTLGQRSGLGISSKVPVYVLKIDPIKNTVLVGTREQAYTDFVEVKKINVLIPDQFTAGARLWAKIRSQGQPQACAITSSSPATFKVSFDQPVFAPTPGQHLVLYNEDGYIVGGGCIKKGLVI